MLSDSEVLPCNELKMPTFIHEFERFKGGISTWKFSKHFQKTQFYNPRPQASGSNGSTHPNVKLEKKHPNYKMPKFEAKADILLKDIISWNIF